MYIRSACVWLLCVAALSVYGQSVGGALKGSMPNPTLRDVINVRDFGAQCNGVYDDSPAFQAAHDSATYGLTISIPAGVCLLKSNINITKSNIKFRGAGQGASYLTVGPQVTKLFNVTSSGAQIVFPEFSDFSVDLLNSPRGTAFYFRNVRQVYLTRLHTNNTYISFWFDQTPNASPAEVISTVHLSHFHIENVRDDTGARGILINGGGDDWFFSNGRLWQGKQAQYNVGLEIQSAGGLNFSQIDIASYGRGLVIAPPAGRYVRWGFFSAIQCDSSYSDTAVIDGTAGQASGYPFGTYNLHFIGSWFSSAGVNGGDGNGLNIVNAQSVSIDTSHFYSNSMNGVRVQRASSDVAIKNSQFSGNSNSYGGHIANVYSGIAVDDGVSHFAASGNRSGRQSIFVNSQKFGITIGKNVNFYRIVENDLAENMTAPIQDLSCATEAQVSLNLPAMLNSPGAACRK